MSHNQKFRILECTLRDGSYVNRFQFTREDTGELVHALETVGFDMIEVGHGMGLGASEKGPYVAAETDETYLDVTAKTLKHADWGMFCIPGIATVDHINLAAQYHMKFIRIGTNVEDYKNSRAFIERAKKFNMLTCSNLMKSYTTTPKEFAKIVAEVEKYGADLVYLVDSAGGMLPEEVEAYIVAIREQAPTVSLAFHGHHNLGLAVANALKAFDLGVAVVDTTLQGFGRGAGNTPTEQFICVLLRRGIALPLDPIAVMDVGEKYIQPWIEAKGLSAIDMVSGLSFFHSSYMPVIEKYATQYRIDPRQLILAVSAQDKSHVPDQLVEEQAKTLAQKQLHGHWKMRYANYYGSELKVPSS